MDGPTATERHLGLQVLADAFGGCPRHLEQLTRDTHGYDPLVYQERLRELLFAGAALRGQSEVRIAAMDSVALRDDGERAWYAAVQQADADARAEVERLAAFDLLTGDGGPALNRCRKCGSTDVEWHQRQTRSADEGITTFCACLSCGKRWRM